MVAKDFHEETKMRTSDNELLKDLRDKIKEINEKFDLMLRNQSRLEVEQHGRITALEKDTATLAKSDVDLKRSLDGAHSNIRTMQKTIYIGVGGVGLIAFLSPWIMKVIFK